MSNQLEIKLPVSIANWIFDLHDATRRSLRSEDVQPLYEEQYKELTDKFFLQSAWPVTKLVAPECSHDDIFLIFYSELRTRHMFTKLKPSAADLTLVDFVESWNNYIAIFDFMISTPNPEIALTTQWVHDIMVEFTYQFQGFCQYRCEVRSRSDEEIKTLSTLNHVWALPTVMGILSKLSSMLSLGAKKETTLEQFSYFAAIEKIRLECLLGDYGAALDTAALIKFGDRSELFYELPSCHVNLYYHTGVCQLMLRKYGDAIDTFVDVTLHIARTLKLGNKEGKKDGGDLLMLMKKMLDKMLALTSICISLAPGNVRLDEQVRELMDSKYPEKMRRMKLGESQAFIDLFESSCPRFISSSIPDYTAPPTNLVYEAFKNQVACFSREVQQHVGGIKLRSYLKLYASIDLAKLAAFSDVSEEELIGQVLSFKLKLFHEQKNATSSGTERPADVNYYVKNSSLFIDTVSAQQEKKSEAERFFFSGVRKNKTLLQIVDKSLDSIF